MGETWLTSNSWIFLLFSSVVLMVVFFLVYFFEVVRRMGSDHCFDVSAAYFEDPNSLRKVAFPSVFDPAEKYISLIIPAFNEEHRLPLALDETMSSWRPTYIDAYILLLCGGWSAERNISFPFYVSQIYLQQRAAADKSFTYEVVIVDDGSTDKTSKVAFDWARKYTIDNVRVILLGKNHGKGAAISQGMLHSRGELLLMLDADGATKVTDLEKLELEIRSSYEKELHSRAARPSDSNPKFSDVAIATFGSRAHLEQQALATRKWYRNILMKGFHIVVLLTAGPGIRDTQCGFKMFTRAAAQKLFTNIRLRRWCFDVELVYLCKYLNIPMIEISVNWSEIPGSKVRMTSILHMLFELLLIRTGYGLGIWKIRA
ncbi:dolichyl-phosphate beta-glucosyltransferase isoform X1 [Amborella trichopoda]|uniref:dolichyl-phosphate beta-glucosyltransferase isoform X1 n=1 Tax=Amborella trichopoda TaxID=13333 RepID=UPI0009BD8914|nr:dolichyl-phosphate beta-glucosyltransferase isoform X1 [Amborella trichopoda]|eukprot:XP_020523993.1 dolichyl-phosphate beta-glucosyltransferase isoform X1 [Amborella trichopoda]